VTPTVGPAIEALQWPAMDQPYEAKVPPFAPRALGTFRDIVLNA
jgi:hypothetical protein